MAMRIILQRTVELWKRAQAVNWRRVVIWPEFYFTILASVVQFILYESYIYIVPYHQ